MTRTVVAATGRHTIRTKERIDECNEHVKSRPLERPRFPCPLFPRGRRPEADRPRLRAMDRVLRLAPCSSGLHWDHGGPRRGWPHSAHGDRHPAMADPAGCRRPGHHRADGLWVPPASQRTPRGLETGLWASIAAVVAIGRWDLVASRVDV